MTPYDQTLYCGDILPVPTKLQIRQNLNREFGRIKKHGILYCMLLTRYTVVPMMSVLFAEIFLIQYTSRMRT